MLLDAPPCGSKWMIAPLAMLLGACWRSPMDDGAASRVMITNGAIDNSDLGVVSLGVDGSGCTGTLVSDRVVVTAGHCVSHTRELFVRFGADATSGVVVPVADVHRHPAWDASTRANDVALLGLADGAPPDAAAWPLWTAPVDASLVGMTVRIVGFGSTTPTELEPGRKHTGAAVVLDVNDTSFTIGGAPSQPCTGDSGGPTFLTADGVEYLVGVTSSGDPGCVEHSRQMRVDVYAESFIAPYVAGARPGAAAPGDRCFYDEQCAEGVCAVAFDDDRVRYCAPSCARPEDCPSDMRCAAGTGRCTFDAPTPGALGGRCAGNADCVTELCAASSERASRVCSVACDPTLAPTCSDGFLCLARYDDATRHACFASEGGGCSAAGAVHGDRSGVLIVLFSWALLSMARRRGRPLRASAR